jgi:predicted secreted protein
MSSGIFRIFPVSSVRFASKRLILALSLLITAVTASAHDNTLYYNQVSIDASASAEVENDTMIVRLYAMQESVDAKDASDRVNDIVNQALADLKQYPDIEVKTESYTTSPVYNKSQIVSWRVRQNISLKSKNMTQLSQLLGGLQRKMKLASIGFDVSKEQRQAHTDRLIDEALTAYDKRASQVASKIKGGGYRIVNMNISTSGSESPRPYMAMRAMAAEADFAGVSPQTEGGKSTLTVRVNGTIELQ